MGFIDKALSKATAERDKTAQPSAASGESQSLPSVTPLPLVMPSVKKISKIDYTVSKTLPVEIDTLVENRLTVGEANPAVLESYKLLRTQILQKTLAERKNTLMVTSPLPSEGKTVTAINLAISLSQEVAHTVLMVDTDLRLPSVHRYFGWPDLPGLTDYLEEQATIPELLVHPQGLDRLVILPAGKPTPAAAELIRSPRMAELVHELKHFYSDRYIIFDLPPMLSYADALAFAPLVDGIIVVVEARKTPREDLVRCKELLAPHPVLGYIFNKAEYVSTKRYYQRYYHRYDYQSNGQAGQGSLWRKLFAGRSGKDQKP